MDPRTLSRQLRKRKSRHLRRRRAIVGLTFTAGASMGLISLFQLGLIRHLPEPPLPFFDADKVDSSAEAYEKLTAPDGFIGLASYSLTGLLAAMGGADRALDRPALPLAMTLKIAMDALQAARLSRDQWTVHRAFCFWCLVAAGATFAALPFSLPEAGEAAASLWSRIRRGRSGMASFTAEVDSLVDLPETFFEKAAR